MPSASSRRDGRGVIVAPAERCPVGAGLAAPVGINPLYADDRKVKRFGDGSHGTVKLRSERMGRIDQQTDVVIPAERRHRSLVERPGDMRPVLALDLLQLPPRRIPIRRTRPIGHPHRQPPLCRSPENQDHIINSLIPDGIVFVSKPSAPTQP